MISNNDGYNDSENHARGHGDNDNGVGVTDL